MVFIQVDNEAARLGTGLQARTGVDDKSPCMKGTQRGGWPPRVKMGTPVRIKRLLSVLPWPLKLNCYCDFAARRYCNFLLKLYNHFPCGPSNATICPASLEWYVRLSAVYPPQPHGNWILSCSYFWKMSHLHFLSIQPIDILHDNKACRNGTMILKSWARLV